MIELKPIKKEDKIFFENLVLKNNYFPWFHQPYTRTRSGKEIDDPFFTHVLISREEERESKGIYHSEAAKDVEQVIRKYIGDKQILRMCFNFTYDNGVDKTGAHKDHEIPYEQIILYLTDNFEKGETLIFNEDLEVIQSIKPKANHYIQFGGNYHANYICEKGFRICLVVTYK